MWKELSCGASEKFPYPLKKKKKEKEREDDDDDTQKAYTFPILPLETFMSGLRS